MKKLVFLVVIASLLSQSNLPAQELPTVNNLRAQQLFEKFNSESFLVDLEVVKSQRKRISEIQEEFREETRAIPKSEPGTNTRFKAMESCVIKSFKKIFDDVLLPHQQVRFVQLVHQDELRRIGGSLANYLVQKRIRPLIGITDRQTKELQAINSKTVEEIRAAANEFRMQVATILAEENGETMALLNDNEMKIVNDLIGEKRNVDVNPGSEAKSYFNQIIRDR